MQAAIDKCSAAGGGTVLVPSGKFLTGTLFHQEQRRSASEPYGPRYSAAPKRPTIRADVARCGFLNAPYIDRCLIYAGEVENIAITGGSGRN